MSGSDYGVPSDEERAYLDNEEDEILERWSGESDVNISEDELKKQVNRVHMCVKEDSLLIVLKLYTLLLGNTH